MHELAIAESIVNSLRREKADRHLARITRLSVRIGELTDIMPEALEFGFQSLISGSELDGCTLIIEKIPVSGECNTCGKPVVVQDFIFSCPHCFSTDLDMHSGQELEIAWYEADDASTPANEEGKK